MKQHDGFIKNSDVNVLLAGGGHKPLSDFLFPSDANATYVKKAGDTMTGNLSMSGSNPLIVFSGTPGGGTGNYIAGDSSGNMFLASNKSGNKVYLESTYSAAPYFRNQNGDFIIYHSGNLPAYPTKASWNYDDVYVKKTGDTMSGRLAIHNDLIVDASNIGDERGIFFRNGFVDSNKYNCSIMVHDHNGDFPDGLSINAYDGISFCTGSNDRLERMRINLNGQVGIGRVADGYILDVQGNTRIYSSRFRWSNWDACLDIYGTETCCGPENVAFQTTFDNRSAIDEHDYTSWYPSRAAIVLQPNGGRVGVNVLHDPSYTLHVNGACAATSFPNISDVRKKNIMSEVNLSLESIYSAPIFKFTWNDPRLENRIQIGSSAQYWRNIIPEATTQAEDDIGTLSMQYDVIALASVITLAKELKKCKERILELENKINTN